MHFSLVNEPIYLPTNSGPEIFFLHILVNYVICYLFGNSHSGNPLQYACLENPMNRAAWWATVQGVAKESDTT